MRESYTRPYGYSDILVWTTAAHSTEPTEHWCFGEYADPYGLKPGEYRVIPFLDEGDTYGGEYFAFLDAHPGWKKTHDPARVLGHE
jgi:hypothetical protein